jgi:hypothetical protein
MSELRLYRMPDENTGGILVATWVLTVNGISISHASTVYGTQEHPFDGAPREIVGLAARLGVALNVKTQYCDRRLQSSAVRLHVVKP